jgi:hypothetical protein
LTFAHFQAMSQEELSQVEILVNEEIQANLPVDTQVMSLEDAKEIGAPWRCLERSIPMRYGWFPWEIFPRSCAAVPMCKTRGSYFAV